MLSSVLNDPIVMASGSDGVNGPVSAIAGQIEVDFVKCDCCGLLEECTPAYIETIRERYGGKWICGLCAEAVKDETVRCQKLISPDEAMARHFSFCNKFRASGPPEDPAVHLIRAMRHLLRRSLSSDSPKSMPKTPKSMPNSPKSGGVILQGPVLNRAESCMPSLALR